MNYPLEMAVLVRTLSFALCPTMYFEREPFMQTPCVRHGQVELVIIEHEGREFAALGAAVPLAEVRKLITG